QGYSVRNLSLLADLFCSAATFPVSFGLYSRRRGEGVALIVTLSGLAAGLSMITSADGPMHTLPESFFRPAPGPWATTLIITRLWPGTPCNLHELQHKIQRLPACPGQRATNPSGSTSDRSMASSEFLIQSPNSVSPFMVSRRLK